MRNDTLKWYLDRGIWLPRQGKIVSRRLPARAVKLEHIAFYAVVACVTTSVDSFIALVFCNKRNLDCNSQKMRHVRVLSHARVNDGRRFCPAEVAIAPVHKCNFSFRSCRRRMQLKLRLSQSALAIITTIVLLSSLHAIEISNLSFSRLIAARRTWTPRESKIASRLCRASNLFPIEKKNVTEEKMRPLTFAS